MGHPALFASLMGGQGTYAITPSDRHVWGGSYELGTLIWRSRWVTQRGVVESREALLYPPRHGTAVILRRVQVLSGRARLEVRCGLATDYGHTRARDLTCHAGVWRGHAGDVAFTWVGGGNARSDGNGTLSFLIDLEAGAQWDFVLSIGQDGSAIDADEAWTGTETAWRQAVPRPDVALAERDAWHARAVLRGLTSRGGGMVAAATMSLPERADAGRSYDYRFAWLRDQAMAGQAAARAYADDLLDAATGFIAARLLDDGPQLAPVYTVSGRPVPAERPAGLPGYPGGTDIAGNHAGSQFQLDTFGEVLLCLAAADERDRLESEHWDAIRIAAAAIAQRRDEAEAGIWELEPDIWTHSRLMCAAGLRSVAARPGAGRRASAWLALADDLVSRADAALFPTGRWQRSLTDERVDAALLFAGIRGATAPDDPRALATLEAVTAELSDDFFAYRYRPEDRPLGEAEGAFLLCGFAMALALHACGRHVEAAHWFERNRSACGPPGLLSEEFDVEQRQLRGNLPQAFVHALLLECAATLPEPSSLRSFYKPARSSTEDG